MISALIVAELACGVERRQFPAALAQCDSVAGDLKGMFIGILIKLWFDFVRSLRECSNM
ncbi:hypothetical protein [Chloroflexus islandicus]|uniref:hypothetical protein n=1 Tax=Chloroflexus islandicus TaxID=1707952 RepID=UPI0012E73D49|nr:hypothetical protein [Chloroflexus islandicus]